MNGGLAPCGMICAVCYRHLAKKSCPGCLYEGKGKPEHCAACRIVSCAREHGHTHCFSCGEFPCERIKPLDKNYRRRYGTSLIEFGRRANEIGVEDFLGKEMQRYACDCGGVISLHDSTCSRCGRHVPRPRITDD